MEHEALEPDEALDLEAQRAHERDDQEAEHPAQHHAGHADQQALQQENREDVALAGAFALATSALAAWIPARRAARADPVDMLRGAT